MIPSSQTPVDKFGEISSENLLSDFSPDSSHANTKQTPISAQKSSDTSMNVEDSQLQSDVHETTEIQKEIQKNGDANNYNKTKNLKLRTTQYINGKQVILKEQDYIPPSSRKQETESSRSSAGASKSSKNNSSSVIDEISSKISNGFKKASSSLKDSIGLSTDKPEKVNDPSEAKAKRGSKSKLRLFFHLALDAIKKKDTIEGITRFTSAVQASSKNKGKNAITYVAEKRRLDPTTEGDDSDEQQPDHSLKRCKGNDSTSFSSSQEPQEAEQQHKETADIQIDDRQPPVGEDQNNTSPNSSRVTENMVPIGESSDNVNVLQAATNNAITTQQNSNENSDNQTNKSNRNDTDRDTQTSPHPNTPQTNTSQTNKGEADQAAPGTDTGPEKLQDILEGIVSGRTAQRDGDQEQESHRRRRERSPSNRNEDSSSSEDEREKSSESEEDSIFGTQPDGRDSGSSHRDQSITNVTFAALVSGDKHTSSTLTGPSQPNETQDRISTSTSKDKQTEHNTTATETTSSSNAAKTSKTGNSWSFQPAMLDLLVDSNGRCVYHATLRTLEKLTPKLSKALIELVEFIVGKMQTNAKSAQAFGYYTAVFINIPAIFLTPRGEVKDLSKELAEQMKTYIISGTLPDPFADETVMKRKYDTQEETLSSQPLGPKTVKRISKALATGNLSRAASCFQACPVADPTKPIVKQELIRLHPYEKTDPEIDWNDNKLNKGMNISYCRICNADIIATISSLAHGRSPGPARWTDKIIRHLAKNCQKFVTGLTMLAQLLSEGKFPHEEMLKESSLIALEKGNNKYRPIAIGNSIPKLLIMTVLRKRNQLFCQSNGTSVRRLTVQEIQLTEDKEKEKRNTKTVSEQANQTTDEDDQQMDTEPRFATQINEEADVHPRSNASSSNIVPPGNPTNSIVLKTRPDGTRLVLNSVPAHLSYLGLSPNQFGANTPCGAELLGFYANELYKSKRLTKIISLDITNAFNTVKRSKLAEVVGQKRPDLFPMVRQLYRRPTELRLSDGSTIPSTSGVRQGDPLSSYLFSLVINDVLVEEEKLAAQYNCKVFAYQDDHTFVLSDSSNNLLTLDVILEHINTSLLDLGLKINRSKCITYIPDYIAEVAEADSPKTDTQGNPTMTLSRNGINLLGVPVGNDEFITQHVKDQLAVGRNILNHLWQIDTQIAFQLLRLCVSTEAVHLLRSLGDRKELFYKWENHLFLVTLLLADKHHEFQYMRQLALQNGLDPDCINPVTFNDQELKSLTSMLQSSRKDSTDQQRRTKPSSSKVRIERPNGELSDSDTLNRSDPDNSFSLNEAKELIRLYSRAKVMTGIKQRHGGLGIHMPFMIGEIARLSSMVDCIKQLRRRNIPVPLTEDSKRFIADRINLLERAEIFLPEDWDKSNVQLYENCSHTQHNLYQLLSTEASAIVSNSLLPPKHDLYGTVADKCTDLSRGITKGIYSVDPKLPADDRAELTSPDTAFGLYHDNLGARAELLFASCTFRKGFSIDKESMKEAIASQLLIPTRYNLNSCSAINTDSHSAVPSNHAYACTNSGQRTNTHTVALNFLQLIFNKLNIVTEREPRLTKDNAKEHKYADIRSDANMLLIDASGVTTRNSNSSLHDAMEKRYNEKLRDYAKLINENKLKESLINYTFIPFIFGPRGQVYYKSEDAILKALNIPHEILDAHGTKLEVYDPTLFSSKTTRKVAEPRKTLSRLIIERDESDSTREVKFLWRRMQSIIAQATYENAKAWCITQSYRHRINRMRYHKATIMLQPIF